MKIAVVFDAPYAGWEDDDYKREIAAKVEEAEYEVAEALMARGHDVRMVGVQRDLARLLDGLREYAPDLVFNCTEAYDGEPALDYLFPALFEAEGYRYTGSGSLALLTTRDKATSKKILAYHGISVPGFRTYRVGEAVEREPELVFPVIVKPIAEDASIGISTASVVQDRAALAERVAFVHERFAQAAIAEEFVEGRELYVSVIGNGEDLDILPLVEMVWDRDRSKPEERIATRLAKWDVAYRERKGIRNVFARPIAKRVRARLTDVCALAFRAFWLRDYARLDVRLAPDGQVWVIEVNANPFISFGHDMANAAEKAGLDYYGFIDRLRQEAVQRYERER